jgi:hypothetical protein
MADSVHTIGAPQIDPHASMQRAWVTPIASLAPMGCPKGIEPHKWRKAIASRIETLSDQMNALISVLDRMDSDPDLEPNGDEEPSLGWPLGHGVSQLRPDMAHDDDREQDDTDAEDGGDDEPSLASPERYDRQIMWCAGSDRDGEENVTDCPHDADHRGA